MADRVAPDKIGAERAAPIIVTGLLLRQRIVLSGAMLNHLISLAGAYGVGVDAADGEKPAREVRLSQWGAVRLYESGTATIRVLPHVRTQGFDPISAGSIIDDLLFLDGDGHGEAAEAIRNQFLGQPYRLWDDPGPAGRPISVAG